MDDGAPGIAASSFAVASSSDRLDRAVWALAHARPDLSAHYGLARWQSVALLAVGVIGLATVSILPRHALLITHMVLIVTFACLTGVRILAIVGLLATKRDVGSAAPACPTDDLPSYTIIVALKDEAAVARQLVNALSALDYPVTKLDILIALEAHDEATRVALLGCGLPAHMRLITVPPGSPRTKPRALAFALTFARGEYVVVYDAEDEPDPQQLRAAIAAFQTGGSRLGCVQAQLTIDPHANGMRGVQFAIEYAVLFDAILPLLTRHHLPVLLGGTSNHFPRRVLESVGGWDPWNVTEDADLGIRLARHGWHVHCLRSATLEDAPACWRDWFAQRRRWQKGWLQTYFVHMRNPARLWRELGPAGFASFQIVLGGSLLCGFAHPLAWLWLISVCSGALLAPSAGLEAALWWGGLLNLAAAAVASITLAVLVAPKRQRSWTLLNCLVAPLYWLPVSAALYRAVYDWIRHPHAWAKTPHMPRTLPTGEPHPNAGLHFPARLAQVARLAHVDGRGGDPS